MRPPLGQAVRHAGGHLRLLARLALGLAVLAAVVAGGLAWRLAQGPLEIGWLARRLETAVSAGTGQKLVIGSAALAWEGLTHGVDRPLDIRLTGVALLGANGRVMAQVPRAELSLSAASLVLGRVVPRALELDGVRLQGERGSDGTLQLRLGDMTDAAGGTAGTGSGLLPGLLRDLAQPAESDRDGRGSFWSQVRRLRLRDAGLLVEDRQLGATWRADSLDLDLRRRPGGGAQAEAAADLSMGEVRAHATAIGILPAGGGAAAVQARLSPVNPARLAAQAPGLAALSALDVPLRLSGSAMLGADLVPRGARLSAEVGSGRILVAQGAIPVVNGAVDAEMSPQRGTLRIARLQVAPRPDGPPTVLEGALQAVHDSGRWNATISGTLDRVAFADLPALWPRGLGGAGTQPWIAANITDGMAKNGQFEVKLSAPDDLSTARVTALSGGIEGHDLTVHWLRPVPPLEHGEAQLSILSPDALEIAVSAGRQAGGGQGGIAVQSGGVRITGLSAKDQFLSIDADLAGPVADLVTVLRHPRLHLLDRRPVEMHDPSGEVTGHLLVSDLPLENDVSVDDVRVKSRGRLSRLHLGGIAAGRDLDDGNLDFEAGNDGLAVRGTAKLANIPAQLQINMDFRAGPPSQIVQKVAVSGTADGRQLAAAGLDSGGVLDGPAALNATLQTRRSGEGDILVRADLARARLQVARLNFVKPAARRASVEAHLLMRGDRITAIDHLRVQGDGMAVEGRVGFAGGAPRTVDIEQLRLGEATDLSGSLQIPQARGEPWIARLAGRSLDVSAEFGATKPEPRKSGGQEEVGPAWNIEARFDQVVLGPGGRVLTGVTGSGESDGRIIRQGLLRGRTAGGGAFGLRITPGQDSRTLSGSSEDAGQLLRALGVVQSMTGGQLSLEGVYDDRAPDHPLQGRAEISDFRVKAPALAKLLQAMTLYGLVEAIQGPGLGFNRLIAPFRYSGRLLELADARAFSASLGMTAKGQIDLANQRLAMEGTIVPAYFFNELLGEIPLIGRLFSPERGGGVFAATYSMRGSLDDPSVVVNPLAALTPGFLRGLFGIFDKLPEGKPAPPSGPSIGHGG